MGMANTAIQALPMGGAPKRDGRGVCIAEDEVCEVAETPRKVVGFEGELVFDTAKRDCAQRELLAISRLHCSGMCGLPNSASKPVGGLASSLRVVTAVWEALGWRLASPSRLASRSGLDIGLYAFGKSRPSGCFQGKGLSWSIQLRELRGNATQ